MDILTMGRIFKDNDGEIFEVRRDVQVNKWTIEIQGESVMVNNEELMEIGDEITRLCEEWEG